LLWIGKNAKFLAEFIPSAQGEIPRCAQDDSEGLGMTGQWFSSTLTRAGLRRPAFLVCGFWLITASEEPQTWTAGLRYFNN